jgi:hypothetical protein
MRYALVGVLATTLLVTSLSAAFARGQVQGRLAVPTSAVALPGGEPVTVATLPDLAIGPLQNSRLPNSIDNDRQLMLGGVGSDLWRAPTDRPGEFWMVTDRGPNDTVEVDGSRRRTFLVPGYTPTILRVRLDGSSVQVQESIPLVGQSGLPVTGLPNVEGQEEPYDYTGQARLAYNPSGLDIEGLVRMSSGEFWAVEEYGPSLVRIGADGTVLRRFVPAGLQLVGADYAVEMALPSILTSRTPNRGFEGITLSPDGATLYLALQSPLSNPDGPAVKQSRQVRILAFDIAAERVVAEYVYRLGLPEDLIAAAPPKPARAGKPDRATKPGGGRSLRSTEKPAPHQMRVSGLAATGPSTLLVLERTSEVARLYRVDLTDATNILGSRWDDPSTTPTLEVSEDPTADGVAPLSKAFVADLSVIPDLPEKIEGVAILDATTIAVANDNDFDLGSFDQDGNNVGKGLPSQIVVVKLPVPLW